MGRAQRSCAVLGDEDYGSLDDLCVPLSSPSSLRPDGTFTLCLWIYLLKNAWPGPAIRMVCSDTKAERPFLTIDQNKLLSLYAWNGSSVSAQHVCPTEKWVHIGCEIGVDAVRLHMDGLAVAEMSLNSLVECFNYRTIILMGGDGYKNSECLQGYTHYVRVLSQPTVTNHYVKHPPLELSLDGSTGASDDLEVEEGGDGIWSVVGGKASCRRNFALDVVLLDALGRSVHKDMEVVALLVYADNGAPVEKPKDDAEAPLLTTFDGVEFPSTERPIKLLHGRASFKLKISQLSSKCDNRLFRVCFNSPNISSYPFLRVFSRPIRCVSRNRNSRVPATPWKRPITATETSWLPEETAMEVPSLHNNSSSSIKPIAKSNPGQCPNKRLCIMSEVSNTLPDQLFDALESSQHVSITTPIAAVKGDAHTGGTSFDMECQKKKEQSYASHIPFAYLGQMDTAFMGNRSTKQERYEEDSALPKFECFRPTHAEGLSDFFVFKYSLENTRSRAAFLKGVATCWSDQELLDFSQQVSRATSCEHNGQQIVIAKRLIQDGNEAWNQIQKEIYPVPWDIVVEHVEKHFQTLSMSKKRHFSPKDKGFLRHVAKCKDHVTREDFDRLWYWIYPVSLSLLNPMVRRTWEVEKPKCILAMVSRQEAEALLMSEIAPKPGTFVLRFVSTCSWPHPDAGGLIVSFFGQDLRVHHKLLSLANIAELNAGDNKLLSEMIMTEVLMQPFS